MLNTYLKTLKSQLRNPKIYSPISFTRYPTSQTRSVHNPAIQFILDEAQGLQSSKPQRNYPVRKEGEEETPPNKQQAVHPSIPISHPWREWVDLMEKLLKNGYFDEIGNPFASRGEVGSKEANLIRTACLNYARDNYQLIRLFSREDIMVIASSGCPSTDRKVVNSGKRLRAHVELNEGNVCSSCILRGDCDRAYVKAREDEGGRTVDVMRFLLTYGLDPITSSVENKPSLNKMVKQSVRSLLKEMVEIKVEEDDHEPQKDTTHDRTSSSIESGSKKGRSQLDVPMKQGDWICPKCDFVNFARNIKCLRCDGLFEERLKKLAEEQEHLPMKKGDWRCNRCNFLNFARNTRCFVCKENPPKRPLNPGEWQCDSCNYLNFKRNLVCLKCDHKRPIASNPAEFSSQTTNDSLNYHQTHHWHEEEKSSRYNRGENEDQTGSSSWNGAPGFEDFPVAGGKSELSCDKQKQERWRMEMATKSRTVIHKREDSSRHDSYIFRGRMKVHASEDDEAESRTVVPKREDSSRHVSYIFRGTGKIPASEDDDEDMAEWFGRGLRS